VGMPPSKCQRIASPGREQVVSSSSSSGSLPDQLSARDDHTELQVSSQDRAASACDPLVLAVELADELWQSCFPDDAETGLASSELASPLKGFGGSDSERGIARVAGVKTHQLEAFELPSPVRRFGHSDAELGISIFTTARLATIRDISNTTERIGSTIPEIVSSATAIPPSRCATSTCSVRCPSPQPSSSSHDVVTQPSNPNVPLPQVTSAPPSWMRFTPPAVRSDRCMARTWDRGSGGQCMRLKKASQDFCGHHGGVKWTAYGRVDGPIPQRKMAEFLLAECNAQDKARCTTSTKRPDSSVEKRNCNSGPGIASMGGA